MTSQCISAAANRHSYNKSWPGRCSQGASRTYYTPKTDFEIFLQLLKICVRLFWQKPNLQQTELFVTVHHNFLDNSFHPPHNFATTAATTKRRYLIFTAMPLRTPRLYSAAPLFIINVFPFRYASGA